MLLLRKKSPSTVTLTTFQENKWLSSLISFEYAHYLHEYYKQQGFNNPEVYVESYVAERKIKPKYIDPKTNKRK
jgi:hypothetical protein